MATSTPVRTPRARGRHLVEVVVHGATLGFSCLITFWLVTHVLGHVHSLSKEDDQLGGMWAVIATIFVYRETYEQSVRSALSRVVATSVSFLICLAYLLFLPFYPWGLAALTGIGAIVVTELGRPQDAITTGITTTVVMVVASLAPHDAWQQPVLRFVDTLVGVVVGVAVACLGLRVTRSRLGKEHFADM